METEYVGRDLGIPAIGMAPWGTHFCQFYGTRRDLLDICIPYLCAGLENEEQCVWRTSELQVDEAVEALSREIDNFDRRLAEGQMTIIASNDWYSAVLTDPERALESIAPRLASARARGRSGIRAVGSVPWLPERDWDVLMGYEGDLNEVMPHRHIIGLCTYSLDRCDAVQLLQVLARHQFALIKQQDWTLIEPSQQKRATAAVEQMNRALAERTTQLQAALADREAALADLRGFSRWVTHDLRAPLRSVRGFSDLLAETLLPRMDDDERQLFDRIQASTDRMDTLITDILAYSSLQQNTLRPQPVDLEALTRESWETLTEAIGAHRVRLQTRPLPQAWGDRTMLRQVLTNLLGNAIKFTGETTDPLVEVGAFEMNGECVYYVRDNGIGFHPADAEKIFGAFERLHGKGEYEGTGLGLAIVKQIIIRHGGRIWAESTPGAGVTFNFTLPTLAPAPT